MEHKAAHVAVALQLLLLVLLPQSRGASLRALPGDCVVTAPGFDAACDGARDDTSAIQAALSQCAGEGRRIVIPPNRTCLAQPLVLPSDTFLLLGEGAVLKAGAKWNQTAFLSAAAGATNITMVGSGGLSSTIDGSGAQWWTGSNKAPGRPVLIYLAGCANVQIHDILLLNAAMFHLYVGGGENFTLGNIFIRSPNYTVAPNTDGIDIGARNVHIFGADITNGDDSICMKHGAENVLVEDSVVRQGNGFVVGTDSDVAIRNITFRSSRAEDTLFGCHIKFKEQQTGFASDILFENITVLNPTSYAIGINQNGQQMAKGSRPSTSGDSRPPAIEMIPPFQSPASNVTISNITFRNIMATVRGVGLRAGQFLCNPGTLACRNISLESVHIDAPFGCIVLNTYGSGIDVQPPSCVPPPSQKL